MGGFVKTSMNLEKIRLYYLVEALSLASYTMLRLDAGVEKTSSAPSLDTSPPYGDFPQGGRKSSDLQI